MSILERLPLPGPRRRRGASKKARDRIQHLVVLMLENRSFDHLLGYLDYPGFEPLEDGEYPNAVGDGAGTATQGVAHDADEILAFDPPHSHVAVKMQMNARGAGFKMDGFINAYARKLRGERDLPVFHWFRLSFLAVGLAAVFGLAGGAISRSVRADDYGLTLALVVAIPVLALVATATPRRLLAPKWWMVASLVLVAALVGAAIAGVVHLTSLPTGWAIGTGIAAAIGLAIGLCFLRRWALRKAAIPEADVQEKCKWIMRCMDPARVGVFGFLAEQFAVCRRWFSSVPGATWPNRNFVHAGTSENTVDIEIGFYGAKTVFQLLEEVADDERRRTQKAWRIYHEGMAQSVVFDWTWRDGRDANWFPLREFFADVANQDLPWYTFIEPCHSGEMSNSQHPGNNEHPSGVRSDFHRGEVLVREVYEALRNAGDLFERTLLVITYDEHGGLFDHKAPPKAKHPTPLRPKFDGVRFARRVISMFAEREDSPFDFRRLGVRVPAIVVSPWINPRTIEDDHVYDHTSVIATLRALFAGKTDGLLARDRAARSLHHLVLDRNQARELPEAPPPSPPPSNLPAATEPTVPHSPGLPELPPTKKVTIGDEFQPQLAALEEQLVELHLWDRSLTRAHFREEDVDVMDVFDQHARRQRERLRESKDK